MLLTSAYDSFTEGVETAELDEARFFHSGWVMRCLMKRNVGNFAAPAFADLNADGDMDLLIGNGDSGCYGGTGTRESATWEEETETLASIDVCANSAPALGDIDGDTDLDLLVGGGYGGIAFYRNVGTPEVPQWASVTVAYESIDVGYKSTPALSTGHFCE